MEARVFKWFRYVSLRPHDVAQWATSLLYSLFDIFWMIIMYCEVSYLYIGLLTQLSYLTYVGFLNISPQTQGVIFNETFEFVYKRIAQISWLNSA